MSLSQVGIIVLAAGSGKRFGSDKRKALMPDGVSLLDKTLSRIPPAFSKRVLVIREEDTDLAQRHSTWQTCIANNPEIGMANSLISGIGMAEDWKGALIGLGDMPYIAPATYHAVQMALDDHDIVIPVYQGQRGNPVAFRKEFFGEIKLLSGDQGARSLLKKYTKRCFELETDDAGIIRDVDTPERIE